MARVQRQPGGEPGAAAGTVVQGEVAAEVLDRPPDDVHADAAAARPVGRFSGRETRARRSGRARRPGRSGRPGGRGRPPGRGRTPRSGSMPRPSSSTSITIAPPAAAARRSIRPRGGFPAATRSAGGFQPVADGVADQVQERVGQPLDHELVDLGVLAGQVQVDLLAGLPGQVADDEPHPGEHVPDRDEADPHHPLAEVAELPLQGQSWSPPTPAARRPASAAATRPSPFPAAPG